jgi:mRNA-degrading endonuclease YafQ of YafQ-DinJ toxin-antitoxin module
MKGKYSFSVAYDLRVIYSVRKNGFVVHHLEQIGAHSKVY